MIRNLRRLPCIVITYLVGNLFDYLAGEPEDFDYVSTTTPMYASNQQIDKEIE